MDFDTSKEAGPEEKQEKIKPSYVSQPGFVKGKIRRGLTEIEILFEIFKDLHINCFICGGYVRYIASPNQQPVLPSDVDIYSYEQSDYDRLKDHLVVKEKLEIRHENNMAVTFKRVEDSNNDLFPAGVLQIVKPLKEGKVVSIGDMKTVLENFDFTIIRAGIDLHKRILVDADFDHDEQKKILRLKNIHCPVSSTLRCMKYAQKGYWLPPTQALALFMDWETRDNDYKTELIELVQQANSGEGLTQDEVDHLEELMRID